MPSRELTPPITGVTSGKKLETKNVRIGKALSKLKSGMLAFGQVARIVEKTTIHARRNLNR